MGLDGVFSLIVHENAASALSLWDTRQVAYLYGCSATFAGTSYTQRVVSNGTCPQLYGRIFTQAYTQWESQRSLRTSVRKTRA